MNIFNIFNIFKTKNIILEKPNTEVINNDDVYFHEDSFNQVEFIPRENIQFVKSENLNIQDFSKQHFDGTGFTDIYERNENPISIKEKQIVYTELDKLLLSLNLKKAKNVYNGYGSAKWKCEDTFAYSFDRATIFVSIKENLVSDFWIDGFRFHEDEETKDILKNILMKIGNDLELIINDWDLSVIVDLKNVDTIQKYLSEELDE